MIFPPKKIDHGFTLMEMMLVLALVGGITCLSWPRFQTVVSGVNRRREIKKIEGLFFELRHKAVLSGQPQSGTITSTEGDEHALFFPDGSARPFQTVVRINSLNFQVTVSANGGFKIETL